MKSQSQLQQQAAAAALAKKSGAHGAATNGRRLRRNVDVVVNALAMKGRSQSSNLTQPMNAGVNSNQQTQLAGGVNNIPNSTSQSGNALAAQNQQYPFLNAQFFHRKQLMNSSGNASSSHHSHSQQVLDNSQAIQQKISMYSNMANAKKHQQLQHSPAGVKTGKSNGSNGSSKIVPAQLSRAFLQQRSNQTPNPGLQQVQYTTGQQVGQNKQQRGGHQNNFMGSDGAGNRNASNAAANVAAYGNQQSNNVQQHQQPSYYDIGGILMPNTKLAQHHQSAQNLEQLPRTGSQKISQGKQPIMQIKGVKSSRNRDGVYGGSTLTNRQKSSKQAREQSNNTLYSQISLKEIQSPVKQYKLASKVNLQKITSSNFYGQGRGPVQGGQDIGAGKTNNYSQQMTQQIGGSNSAQAFVQYTQQHQPSAENYVTDIKDIQQLMSNMNVDEPSSSQGTRSRNNITNVVTTNGATTNHNQGNHGGQGAILNINTASDINIYNNSFIVQTSPGQTQTQLPVASSTTPGIAKAASTSSNRHGSNKRQTQKSLNNGSNSQSSTHRVGTNPKANGRSSGSVNNQALLSNTTTAQNQHGFASGNLRSMSTGRNQKSATGSRAAMANNGKQQSNQNNSSNNNLGQQQSKTSRSNALNEAYIQNRNYVINNQVLAAGGQQVQQQQQPVISTQQNAAGPAGTTKTNQQQQVVNSWRGHQQNQASNNIYTQQPPTGKQNKPGQVKSYNSTENIKRLDESAKLSTGGAAAEKRNNSLNKPQYQNLVNDSQKRLVFAQESGISMTNKRNFKNVRKNREAFNTQPIGEITQNQGQKVILNQKSLSKQKQTIQEKIADLISKGRQKIKSKDFNDAIKLFSEILENLDKANSDAIFYRAISYLDQGNLQQAINELWQVINSQSVEAHEIELSQQAYVLLSIAHKRLGEIQNAIQDLEQCIEKYPSYPDAYLARGQTLLLQEEFTLALADFQKFLSLNHNSFSGYLGVGDCHKANKNFDQATQAYTKAIKLLSQQKSKPNYEQLYQQCYMKRGLSGYHEGNHQQALADLQSVIERDTSNVKAHFYIGKLLTKKVENAQSKQTDAILHFEQVAKYPDQEFYSGNALFQIAKLRLRQKDYYEAFHCLKRAADNNFSSKRLTMYKDFTEGVIYLIKRKIKKGVQILSDLLEILINKDKDNEKKDNGGEDGKQTLVTMDKKKRLANKVHQDYLIHQILLFRAYGYVAIEKYEIAQDDIRKVDKYGDVDAATIYNKWLGKGILRMDHEDYLMASKFFSKAWKKYPSNKDPYCLQVISIVRSYSYSLGGYNIDQSIKFEKVLETKKFMDKAISNCCPRQKEPSLYFFRGLLNFQMHNFYDALADFNRAIDAEEDSSAYFFLARGRTYACLSILTEAMKDLSVALNLDETLQQAYIYRGKCAYLIGDNNLAFLDFQRLILTDPKNPMVHVYAGNLLMTTGAYQDAIKAYENADTVEPTTVSSFQRVRCFCALSDLDNAKILLEDTKKMQPDDVILKFDGLCLDELIKVAQVSETLTKAKLTPADVKSTDSILTHAITTFDELVSTYESDRLLQLKRRDSILNVQVIPNVEKIKIEKSMVAQDFQTQKEQLPIEQHADLPSLSIDLDEPVVTQNLKRLKPYSYYYENIFNVEDFYLYRGVFKFYQKRYEDALVDFDRARVCVREQANDQTTRGQSGLNTKNPTLQHYTMGNNGMTGGRGSAENTLQSNLTDLSDIGLSSFNDLEIIFNIFLCYFMLNDRVNALNKLNELQRKTPKKYTHQIPLLRIITLEHFQETDKAKSELSKLKKENPDLYSAAFGNKKSSRQPFLVEPFPGESRLCAKFTPQTLSFKNRGGILAHTNLQIRLSFSMPFIKPPNMIPNVDEESIQSEFNLKQIDAPMPEAPWIKRCAHGINFTNHITKDGKDKDKFKKFFEEKDEQKKLGSKKLSSQRNIQSASNLPNQQQNATMLSARTRLLDNMVAEEVSDRHKISLVEDNSPRIHHEEDECKMDQCPANHHANGTQEQNLDTQEDEDEMMQTHLSDQVLLKTNPNESDESYDSEDILEKGANGVMAIRDSGAGLIQPERDSMVNMGENMTRDNYRELRKMKKEIVDPGLSANTGARIGVKDLLPRAVMPNAAEETKLRKGADGGGSTNQRAAKERYAVFNESDEINMGSGILPESQMQSARQVNKLAASQQLAKATQAEPHGLNERMLAGDSQIRRQRERRVSNLSIGDLGGNVATPKLLMEKTQTDKNTKKQGGKKLSDKEVKNGSGERRSLFRTSIADESI